MLFVFTQFRTENRCTLFLELLFVFTQFRTENRYTLFLELLYATECGIAATPSSLSMVCGLARSAAGVPVQAIRPRSRMST